jgi:hypothetical protein
MKDFFRLLACVSGFFFGIFFTVFWFTEYKPFGEQCDVVANHKIQQIEKIINPNES